MKPCRFPASNKTLAPPPGMENCEPLEVYADSDGTLTSCWKMSWRERLSALIFGRAWLIVAGNRHPPVAIIVKG